MPASPFNSPDQRPIIGICTSNETASWTVWERQPAVLVGGAYVRAVEDAGGSPVLLAPTSIPDARLLDVIDGLLLPGGLDIAPAQYGAEVEPGCESTDPERDSFELAMLRAALDRDIPVLGICRGLQLINVALGGSLHQDIEAGAAGGPHRAALGSLGPESAHSVEFVDGTVTASIAGAPAAEGRSHHHQAIGSLGSGVTVTGKSSDDGVVEAIEVEGRTFAVGVQWHAEATPGDPFIPAFVAAARTSAAARQTA